MLVAAPGGVWNAELAMDRHETVHWIWDGILASGAMTLLTASVRRKEMRPLLRTAFSRYALTLAFA